MDLLALPRRARNNIFERALRIAHPLYLFQDPHSPVEVFAPDKPCQWLALLHVNRQISSDACALLYGTNTFSLLNTTRQQARLLQDFLKGIGPVNAKSLSHVCIKFPVISGKPGDFTLDTDSLQTLELLQEHCRGLKTLELAIPSKISGTLDLDGDNPTLVHEALPQVDVQLRAVRSLERVVIRFFGDQPALVVRESMRSFGWVVLSNNKHG